MNGTTKESNVDVLVIGAGPAGLMAANALSQADIDFRIIDIRYNSVHALFYFVFNRVYADHLRSQLVRLTVFSLG